MPHHLVAPGADFEAHFEQGGDEERARRSRSVTPSEIAAVMGRSPWKHTREDLLRRKSTDGTRPPMAKPARPGLGQEKQPELATAFAASHPQYRLVTTGYWRNRQRPWQRSQPHRLLVPTGHDTAAGPAPIVGTLTFRTTCAPLDDKDWGPDDTTVPPHIYDELQWLLDTFGLSDHGYVIAYSSHNDETRTYRITRDETHIAELRQAARAFLDEVASATTKGGQ